MIKQRCNNMNDNFTIKKYWVCLVISMLFKKEFYENLFEKCVECLIMLYGGEIFYVVAL